jgi:hypothetical protein
MMGVSMVIAAWGEGVNVYLCPPSPSSDCSLTAQNARKKNAGWGLWARLNSLRVPAPCPGLISKKGQLADF